MIPNFVHAFSNLEFTFSVTLAFISLSLIISSLEELVAFPVYANGGLLSWQISKHRSSFFLNGFVSKAIDFILKDNQFRLLLIFRIGLSITLLLCALLKIFSPILIVFVLALWLLNMMRSPYGLDGAYQMTFVVLIALSIAFSFGVNSQIGAVCLWFLAAELMLSYFIAGLVKIISPIWRKSYALPAIFSTKIYGHAGMFQLVIKHKFICYALCWPTFLLELFFVFAPFNPYLCFFFCLLGCTFHLFNAIFMGLNTFFFAFLATYPALFYCCSKINAL